MPLIDIACLAVMGIIVWCVSTEGMWGAAQTFLCVLLSALLAMNYFEPLAIFLNSVQPAYDHYMDIVALVGLFTGFVFALRLGTEHLSPIYIGLPSTVDQIGKWAFAALTGYLTMAFLLTALHTAPLPREFMGFKAERPNFFGMAPDRQWLGFVQYVTEKPFGYVKYYDPESKQFIAHAFDGRYDKLGDSNSPYPNTIWPSFPIRYAMRRDRIGGDQQPTTSAPAPVQPVAPIQNGGNVGF
jgi:hypothetical protein